MSDDPLTEVNRFVIVVAALLVAFAALLVVLLAWGATDGSIGRVEDFAGYLRDHDGRDAKLIVTLAAVVVVMLMLTILVIELTPSPLQQMRVRGIRSGDAWITTAQIAERVEAEVREVPHVMDCSAAVAARGRRAETLLDLHVGPGANLTDTADDACRRTQELVEQRMGIELTRPPRARLHYRELRLREDQKDAAAAASGPTSPAGQPSTGWERPDQQNESERERREQSDAPEEAQA